VKRTTVHDLQTQLKASFVDMVTSEPYDMDSARARASDVLTIARAAQIASRQAGGKVRVLDDRFCLTVVRAALLLKDEPGGADELRRALAWAIKAMNLSPDAPAHIWLTAELDKAQPKGAPQC